ncbi:hypothetical protein JTE90_019952 [Oedothorax gibbosus]|uniref:THAP-type domain-containing protein n=1 Tax=Oedothorax gibbosus TaxID=931172 RepID=A0AAV6UT03_9ARAC|nr:hypothetical protein JTE90_019952 [Oedothorax gibbosus]
MPNSCVVLNCKEWRKKGFVTLHRFPKDPERRKLWENKVKKTNFKATNSSRICSKHFTDDCYDTSKFGGPWLKENAVPSIFENFETLSSSRSTREFMEKKLPEKRKSNDEIVTANSSITEENKHLCYLGDFDETIVLTPKKAKKLLRVSKSKFTNYKKQIKR